jgi:hypothetical protein
MAVFRNFGVNRRLRLCGVQNRPPPRNADAFLELAKNGTFLVRKLISFLNDIADGYLKVTRWPNRYDHVGF